MAGIMSKWHAEKARGLCIPQGSRKDSVCRKNERSHYGIRNEITPPFSKTCRWRKPSLVSVERAWRRSSVIHSRRNDPGLCIRHGRPPGPLVGCDNLPDGVGNHPQLEAFVSARGVVRFKLIHYPHGAEHRKTFSPASKLLRAFHRTVNRRL